MKTVLKDDRLVVVKEGVYTLLANDASGHGIDHIDRVYRLSMDFCDHYREADRLLVGLAALLHDVGKAIDQDIEGSHAAISRDICKKFGMSDEVVHAVEAHHEEVPFKSVEAVIVQVVDAISAGRPGAVG